MFYLDTAPLWMRSGYLGSQLTCILPGAYFIDSFTMRHVNKMLCWTPKSQSGVHDTFPLTTHQDSLLTCVYIQILLSFPSTNMFLSSCSNSSFDLGSCVCCCFGSPPVSASASAHTPVPAPAPAVAASVAILLLTPLLFLFLLLFLLLLLLLLPMLLSPFCSYCCSYFYRLLLPLLLLSLLLHVKWYCSLIRWLII